MMKEEIKAVLGKHKVIEMEKEHEHKFTKKVRNDMNTKWLYICEICGCQDGTKFWAMLNEKWNKQFNKADYVRNNKKK
jgi:hypothetical protein